MQVTGHLLRTAEKAWQAFGRVGYRTPGASFRKRAARLALAEIHRAQREYARAVVVRVGEDLHRLQDARAMLKKLRARRVDDLHGAAHAWELAELEGRIADAMTDKLDVEIDPSYLRPGFWR